MAFQVQDSGFEHLPASESQQLAGQGHGPVTSLDDLGDVVPLPLAGWDFPQQHLSVAVDDCQEIVQVISDAARELADRLHFFGREELGRCSLPFRDRLVEFYVFCSSLWMRC